MSSPWQPTCGRPRDLVVPVAVGAPGGPTPAQARGPRWRRTSRGFYVPADVDGSRPEQRAAEASVLLPVHGAVTGWAALRMAGAAYFDGLGPDRSTRRPVALVAGPGQARRPRSGVDWSQDRLPLEEVWTPARIPCTRPARALLDEMRRAPDVRRAVLAMDMAAAADLVSLARMGRECESRSGWAGVPVVRRALRLADESSRSPGESWLRLVWQLDADRPRPLTNREVFDADGRLLGVADLLDPVVGVVGEYDGEEHARAGRRARDASRDTAFRDAGLEVFRVTGFDVHHPQAVVARIHSAYARAAHRDRHQGWTLVTPPGWPRTPSLDEVLDTRDVLRELHAPTRAQFSSGPSSPGPRAAVRN